MDVDGHAADAIEVREIDAGRVASAVSDTVVGNLPGADRNAVRRQNPDTSSPSPEMSPKTETTTHSINDVVSDVRLAGRPKRMPKTPALPSISTAISERELKAATQRNTAKNMVFHCAIDREIVKVPGPRPPSPTSKIRTTADKEEEIKKAGRGQRAKRRSRSSDGESETEDTTPLIEKVERFRGPGEDEDYSTPARPGKKAKTSHAKSVKWDRQLTIVRDDSRPGVARTIPRSALLRRSSLKAGAQVSRLQGIMIDQRLSWIASVTPLTTGQRRRSNVTAYMLPPSSMTERSPFPPQKANHRRLDDRAILGFMWHHNASDCLSSSQLSL